jgi:serine O-acetyltransferase
VKEGSNYSSLFKEMLRNFINLLDSIVERDPAARSRLEVALLYPGVHAVCWQALAHFLWAREWFFAACWVSQLSRWLTQIEIHPGATIGANLFIDHGSGVVIGETAIVGDNVTIYHGVTLGGTSYAIAGRRHPLIGDNVMVGAGAKLLGPITVGNGARVGANAVVVKDVPAGAVVTGVPAAEAGV